MRSPRDGPRVTGPPEWPGEEHRSVPLPDARGTQHYAWPRPESAPRRRAAVRRAPRRTRGPARRIVQRLDGNRGAEGGAGAAIASVRRVPPPLGPRPVLNRRVAGGHLWHAPRRFLGIADQEAPGVPPTSGAPGVSLPSVGNPVFGADGPGRAPDRRGARCFHSRPIRESNLARRP